MQLQMPYVTVGGTGTVFYLEVVSGRHVAEPEALSPQ